MYLVCYKTTEQTPSPPATYCIDQLVLFLDSRLKYIESCAELFIVSILKLHHH